MSSIHVLTTGHDINVCPIPVKTDVGQVDLVSRLSDGTSEKIVGEGNTINKLISISL
jgi:hypothetical protein